MYRLPMVGAFLFCCQCLPAAAPPQERGHWAFRGPVRAHIPPTRYKIAHNPIDAFILARLESAGLRPAEPADRTTLIRRLTFDLIGLPPTPGDVTAFVADTRPDAYERLVDRLLASPHHGERWAQHWLDVARYAETNGYEGDGERSQAWRYRDWVVGGFNDDKPYNRFLTEQLAGDLLAKAVAHSPDLLIAAGFNRCGPIHQVSGNVDPLEVRHELLNEMTAGLGAAFLGLTLGCARCHDHKFDPISQRDYYRLEAFFSAAQPREADLGSATAAVDHARQLALLQAKVAPLNARVSAIEGPYRNKLREAKVARLEPHFRAALVMDASKRSAEQKKLAAQAETLVKVTWDEVVAALPPAVRERRADLRGQIHELTARFPPPPPKAWTLTEGKEPLAAHVLRRGNIHRRGPRVEPGFPEIFGSSGPTPANRIGLAAWLTRPDHPLTARVIVNRLWQHHFGHGLVRTPNDFGIRGDRPRHPDLLDWLAVDLIESGWSLKHVHRLIVMSATYRQSSRNADERDVRIDPDNRLLARMSRGRLQGETLRDAVLAVSGQLTDWLGGPMVRVPLEPEVYDLIFTEGEPDGLWSISPDNREHRRRSLYLFNKRNVRLPLLEAFDQPDTLTSCPVRPVSTFAPQALILLNGPFMQSQARALACRIIREAAVTPHSSSQPGEGMKVAPQIDIAFRLALGRAPRPAELTLALAFLDEQAELLRQRLRAWRTVALPEQLPPGTDPARAAALADFCLALLNRNAFVHVD
jgi:hypothetical protein